MLYCILFHIEITPDCKSTYIPHAVHILSTSISIACGVYIKTHNITESTHCRLRIATQSDYTLSGNHVSSIYTRRNLLFT